jgi:stearoyl-CoA desaturase (Delta-9 desaturase)
LAAVIVPLLGLAAAIVLLWQTPFHWTYIALFGGMYALTALGIGVGYHRLFTHKSFETSPVFRFIWAVLGSMAVEGPVITWVAVHRKHHQHTDVAGDPHSPHIRGADGGGAADAEDGGGDEHEQTGLGALLRGMWHAHVGWLFDKEPADVDRYAPDLVKDPVVSFVSRTFALWAVLGLLIPALLGGLLTRSWTGVLLGLLWGGLARVLLVHHVTWSINSVCHLWGSRPFSTGDESRDNPVLGVLALGEGWHNTHHAFPTSARHGLAWWKLDINYLVIRAMALLHLARNVRLPTPERIDERRRPREA